MIADKLDAVVWGFGFAITAIIFILIYVWVLHKLKYDKRKNTRKRFK